MCHQNVVWKTFVPDCVRSNMRIEIENFPEGGHAPRPPSRHAHLCVCERAFARYCHPATILFSPHQLKIETLLKNSLVCYSGTWQCHTYM